ncbi:hypothetical protein EJ076_18565 [Mesorhizobium sp. M7D.F.Ca.US.005.01.1.1]|uniref:hypothetical protein n=1 Tax=Mesorhizobium TaxID=68287 RepID=UPI000F75E423|nr:MULTISPECIES: hypothetical protein [Mesorhizobium]AZO42955.1 hypothetical protein EJ076_18565 [Mesorhizobium sp. M7D.F.Ca.US.005.01.1.1]
MSPSSSVAAGSWPVEPGRRETVTLTALRSLPGAIYDSIFGGQYDYVTLVEYSASKALGANAREVVTTGNSLTFKVDASQAMTNIVSGSGPKTQLPYVVYYRDERLEEKGNGGAQIDKHQKVTLLVYSTSVRNVELRKNHSYEQTPTPEAIAKALDSGPAGSASNNSGTQADLTDTGQVYCGYAALRDESAYRTLNSQALAGLNKPFDTANVFVRFDAARRLTKILYCSPSPGTVACRSEEFLNSWAPFTLSFDSQFFCGVDDLADKARVFLKSNIVRETVSNATVVND